MTLSVGSILDNDGVEFGARVYLPSGLVTVDGLLTYRGRNYVKGGHTVTVGFNPETHPGVFAGSTTPSVVGGTELYVKVDLL